MNKPAKLRSRNPGTAEGQMMYSLVRAAHVLESRLEGVLEQVGLSLPKVGALSHLVKEGEPLSLSECATKMTCVRSNMTQLVDRLEADGLVRRVEDPEDRRAVRAVATPLGKERYAAGAREVEKVQAEFAKTISGIDRGALERVLSAIK
jgi:DNA-binding MarR family transcriptional regulator